MIFDSSAFNSLMSRHKEGDETTVVPRMRTLDQCAVYFKEQDPETTLTRYRIRQMVLNGTIPHVMCGKKYLVNLDKLIEYLSEPETAPEPEKKIEAKRLKVHRLVPH